MFTQVDVKQLTDFLRTETAASDLVDCTLVNCETVDVKYLKFFQNLKVPKFHLDYVFYLFDTSQS